MTGCDTIRSLADEYRCFNPRGLKFRYYFNNWDLGHRQILNLRQHEIYTRYYHRLDADSPNAISQNDKRREFKADPAYYIPNEKTGLDPESVNPRYRICANGLRDWSPVLTTEGLAQQAYTTLGVQAAESGIQPVKVGKPGGVQDEVEVLTSVNGEQFPARAGSIFDYAGRISRLTTCGRTRKPSAPQTTYWCRPHDQCALRPFCDHAETVFFRQRNAGARLDHLPTIRLEDRLARWHGSLGY